MLCNNSGNRNWEENNCFKLYVDIVTYTYIGQFEDDCGKLQSQVESQRHCAQKKPPKKQNTAVVIYWVAKSHKMSLTTLLHSYQSVSYFSLTPTVTCLSFPVLGESKFPLA